MKELAIAAEAVSGILAAVLWTAAARRLPFKPDGVASAVGGMYAYSGEQLVWNYNAARLNRWAAWATAASAVFQVLSLI